TPLYLQITKQVKKLIENNTLRAGARIPSTRYLAEKLGIHRTTVYRAYEELWALGYIESRPGSITRIRKRAKIATIEEKRTAGILDWDRIITSSSQDIYQLYQQHTPERSVKKSADIINLSALDMDKRLIPADDFRRCLNQVLRTKDATIYGYGERAGYKPLRKYIARRLQIHGIAVSADEVIITNGSQNGIDMILRLLTFPGAKVIVESPTYALILPLLRYYQTDITGIPMNHDGIDLEKVERQFEKSKPVLLYTMPNFQNPTGITTDQTHRETLLSLCERFKVPLIEDGFEEEMKYFGKVALPIKSMDKHHLVLYLGTFSKILMPGVRIGWIAAEKACIERLLGIKRFCDLSSNSITQAAMAEFCQEGYYDLHVKRMHRIFRKRMQIALKAMARFMPPDAVTWTRPSGGYLIWCHLPQHQGRITESEHIFQSHGVSVSPGEFYFPDPPAAQYFRISISTLDEAEIEEGIRRLGLAIEDLVSK
ncbi:PLP-dependent aminotransferase family protein, partial [candidate division CSSED10-310 bacterium]